MACLSCTGQKIAMDRTTVYLFPFDCCSFQFGVVDAFDTLLMILVCSYLIEAADMNVSN